MEEQIIRSTMNPRVTFKKMSKGNNWEIASSDSKDKEELKRIVEMILETNKQLEKGFEVDEDEVEIR